jgi:hypothetical protein
MAAALKQALTGYASKDVHRGQSARRKMMMAAEWGKQLLSLLSFIAPWKISGSSQPFVLKRERQHESDRPRVGTT